MTGAPLLVDLGNSALRWCTQDQLVRDDVQYLRHHQEDLPGLLSQAWDGIDRPARLCIGSVAGAAIDAIVADWARRHWHLEPEFCRAEREAFGVRNGYRDPGQLGVDRWLVMVAARQRLRSPVCIVDCGTAMTIDALAADGRHLGGYIVPGVASMRRALLDYTRIPRVEHIEAGDGFGRDTASAVAAGGRLALAGAVTRAVHALESVAGVPPTLLLTGSEAPMISSLLALSHEQVPHLVLEGIACYARGAD